ncbi:aminoglycoside adenylyltransferase domain-containing protein [Solibacillus sp. FSL R7-0668]|uniref:aminoglycoside adenylyltransferase domain-containing protein n=1 Tax=Solibacillus sp. FSL R7-0668 TaxID=2921688 RepID=UPI0030F7EB53
MKKLSNVFLFIDILQHNLDEILQNNFIGTYIHGSLALGGFNDQTSDIDLIVVTKTTLSNKDKNQLAKFLLVISGKPFPIEISFLHIEQLKTWRHPCPYDFHYSEYWRERTMQDLLNHTSEVINEDIKTDVDLAAHLTIIHYKGICYKGQPICDVFPQIPQSDYIDAIMNDFNDCLENINETPMYSILNMLRVYIYLKHNLIFSKQEAGTWGLIHLSEPNRNTISKALNGYCNKANSLEFTPEELASYKQYILNAIEDRIGYFD